MIDHDQLDVLEADWLESPEAFASCFQIPDKNTRVVDFDCSPPQRQALQLLERAQKSIILKGRQMWITTILLVWQLRLCYFQPGATCVVVLHTDKNAALMSDRLLTLYRGNPILCELMPLAAANGHRVAFENPDPNGPASQILFTTANSEFLRSITVNFAHLSEARDYDDLGATLASLKVAPEGGICIESTAGGEDDFHGIWVDSDPMLPTKGDYERIFLCWRDHPEYRSDVDFTGRLLTEEVEYLKAHALKREEANWWLRERRGLQVHKRHLMPQENPSTADEAFLLAGDKFLKRRVPMPDKDGVPIDEFGVMRLLKYDPTHQYVAGIDPAPGSSEQGDPTGLTILDVTVRAVAATQEFREPTREHEGRTRKLLAEYGDPVTVVETASEGLGLCDFLRGAGVPMFHMVAYGGLNPELLPRHGWRTDVQTRPILFGGIYEAAIGMSPWTIGCHRLVGQLNALCYNKKAKPAAPKNGHDDLAVSFGLALQGVPQALPARQKVHEPKRIENALEAMERILSQPPVNGDRFDDPGMAQPGDYF